MNRLKKMLEVKTGRTQHGYNSLITNMLVELLSQCRMRYAFAMMSFMGGFAVSTFAEDDNAINSRAAMITLSGRAGAQIEDQTADGKEIWNYTAPFIGGQFDARLPLSGNVSLNGFGYLDLAYGSGTYQDTDFDEALARLKLQSDLAFDIPIDEFVISPFAGLGFRFWNWGDPDPNFLHIESWSAIYGVLGIRGEIKTDRATYFGQMDVQIPFSETISVEGSDYDFEDSDETSMVTAEVGFSTKKISASLFGEFFTYKNDSQSAGIGSEINKNTIGVKLGVIY